MNLTLNADLVARARRLTPNRSGAVETLLVDYVARETAAREAEADRLRASARAWAAFAEGESFSDEFSTL